MAEANKFKAKSLDISEFSYQNIGMWPLQYRGLLCFVLLVVVLVAGYFFHVKDLYGTLSSVSAKEEVLRTTYKKRAFEAANIDAYRQQMVELKKTFGALLAQLPGDTEVPGLLEDITEIGYGSSLEIKTISLQPEKSKEFYVELPIRIVAEGGYHDVGTFVSGIAGLPRIVTLHDFSIKLSRNQNRQVFEVKAKTYRYKGQDD
ncbi:MAG: pilus assembly protein PilP [Gammaproteobacteria bacterium]|nr:MAG: pilus assembly protein PilP [Gammaproteobacteria bacterium]RLA54868.1 MAG: pilus assembly protein PilP [Gammaproteobacteria bacterium]